MARPGFSCSSSPREEAVHLGRPGAVVEDREPAAGVHDDIVLEGGARPGRKREARVFSAQTPDDLAAAPVDLVRRRGVAHRDDQVAVGGDRDRVHVVGVDDVSRHAGPVLVGLAQLDVVQRVPFEQDQARLDVDLLDDAVDHRPRGSRDGHRRGGDQVGVAAVGHDELVEIRVEAVARADRRNPAIVAVEDDADAAPAAPVLVALPPGQHLLTVKALDAEIRRQQRAPDGARVKPDEVASGTEDHRAVLHGPVLRRHEDVSPCRLG